MFKSLIVNSCLDPFNKLYMLIFSMLLVKTSLLQKSLMALLTHKSSDSNSSV